MWKEGLFIMPQHLQLLDTYHEDLLDRRLNALGSHVWGVSEVEIDKDELSRGIFQLNSCTAVMPDGALVQIGKDHRLKGLMAMISGKLKGGDRSLEIYLGVPSADLGGVAMDVTASGARFLHEAVTVTDVYDTTREAELDCVRPNAQLLVSEESRQNYVAFKLAELSLDETGHLSVEEGYIPPMVRIGASPALMGRLEQMVAALSAKQKNLVARYGHRAASVIEYGGADVANLLYMHTVGYWLPIFLHYADSGDLHPEQLFLSLSAFAGQLTTFKPSNDPLDLPRFRYLDLRGTFTPLFDRIMDLLGTEVSATYKSIPIEQTQPGLFEGRVVEPQLLRNHMLYMIAGGEVADNTLRDDLPRYVKVGSVEEIVQIVNSALPGVAVSVDLAPPPAIPVRTGNVYLRLEQEGRYWDSIVRSGTIAIYQPVDPEQVQLELVAVEV